MTQEEIIALSNRIAALLREHEIRMTSLEFTQALKLEKEAPLEEALTYGCESGEICEVVQDLYQLRNFKSPTAVEMLRREKMRGRCLSPIEVVDVSHTSQKPLRSRERVVLRRVRRIRKRVAEKKPNLPPRKRLGVTPPVLRSTIAPIELFESNFSHEDTLCGFIGRFIMGRGSAEPWQVKLLITRGGRLDVSDDDVFAAIRRLISEDIIWRDERSVLRPCQPEQKPTP